jgi:SAM-dependent methyltransferase
MAFPDTLASAAGEQALRAADESALAISEDTVFAAFARKVQLRGAVVAEIGGSVLTAVLRRHGVARWYCIDPNRRASGEDDELRQILTARAERMPLADASVDAVFSSNAFQFLDVVSTLAQARRVLRPGGLLYAHFGPIWSAIDGHQLEYVRYQDRGLAFWRDTLLPPWAHLSYRPEELRRLLRSALPQDLADLLVWHVHESPTINRCFFEDYVAAALASGLDWEEVSTSSELDYKIATPKFDPALLREPRLAELSAEVSQRRGAQTQLGVRDVRLVLRQPRN